VRGPYALQFWGSFLFMHTPFVAELSNITWYVTHVGRSVYLGVSHASHPKRADFQRSPILVVLYLCLHSLTQNDQIRHGKTYGEGRVLGSQPRHCICTSASRGLSAIADFLVYASLRFNSKSVLPALRITQHDHCMTMNSRLNHVYSPAQTVCCDSSVCCTPSG